jgi:MoaA/NifB/PqqE/SkfB family radical SAM enzyme
LKKYRFFWYELKRVAAGIKHTASIDITDACNLRCVDCYHFRDKNNIEDDIPESLLRERFLEIHNRGIRFVTLLGGEPALRLDVLKRASEIFPLVDVITNGTIKIPVEFNHRLFVSVDGIPEIHDKLRGKGAFERIIKNYSGDQRVIIFPTLNRINYIGLEELTRIAKEHNFKGVACGLYMASPGSDDPQKLLPEERKLIIEEVRRVRSLYRKTVHMTDFMLKWYEKADHRDSCYVRDQILHFDVSWKEKMCFGDLDCSNCGCLAGASQSPLKKLTQLETIKTIFQS